MLILPLHRPLTAATFPYATALLVVLNFLVFLGWQSGDAERADTAARYYDSVALHEVELPAYLDWRRAHAQPEPTQPPGAGIPRSVQAALWIQADDAFLADLRADRVITPDHPAYAEWKPRRAEFDRLWGENFTERHLLRFSEIDVGRMFSAMFLHGGIGHLVGNMVFLAILGLLVEGALGSRQFLALYLLGGLGSQLASLAFRWGETGGALGASGAIAALMGAFCVLWGTRPVRVFVWFFVVFDYLRVRALWLLPVWLGWELLNLAFNDGAGIGFDAHAGGIASGALLGWGVVRLGRERRAFLDEDVTAQADDRFPRALAHLGRLEIPEARALLAPLAAADDAPFAVRVAWYRGCRYEATRAGMHDAALRVLGLPVAGNDRAERAGVLDDYLKACKDRPGFDLAQVAPLVRGWLEADAGEEAERLLRAVTATAADATPGLPESWLQLARHWHAHRDDGRARAACALVVQHFPATPAAQKAAFMLSAENTP
jgi:membrane associated rhomboid family serine protease